MAAPKFGAQVDMFGESVEIEPEVEVLAEKTHLWTYMPPGFVRMRHVTRAAYHIVWIPMQALDDLVNQIYFCTQCGVVHAHDGVNWPQAWKAVIEWAREASVVLKTALGWKLDLTDSTGQTGTQEKPLDHQRR